MKNTESIGSLYDWFTFSPRWDSLYTWLAYNKDKNKMYCSKLLKFVFGLGSPYPGLMAHYFWWAFGPSSSKARVISVWVISYWHCKCSLFSLASCDSSSSTSIGSFVSVVVPVSVSSSDQGFSFSDVVKNDIFSWFFSDLQRLTSFSTKSVGVTWNYALVKKSSGLQYSYMLLYWWNYLSNMDVY
jgi:hypothetical protein